MIVRKYKRFFMDDPKTSVLNKFNARVMILKIYTPSTEGNNLAPKIVTNALRVVDHLINKD